MTIYEVFYTFYETVFPTALVTEYQDTFELLAIITTFGFIFMILKGLKRIFKVFKWQH